MANAAGRNSIWIGLAALGTFLGGAAALLSAMSHFTDPQAGKATALASIQSSCIGLAQANSSSSCATNDCLLARRDYLLDEAAVCECANEALSKRSASDLKSISEIEEINLQYWAWHDVVKGDGTDAELNRLLKKQKTHHRLYSAAAQARHACRLTKR